jgi:hypothetical protein
MKVYFLAVLQHPERMMVNEANLNDFGFFQRSRCVRAGPPPRRRVSQERARAPRSAHVRPVHSVYEFMVFFSKTLAKRTTAGTRQSVTEKRTCARAPVADRWRGH